MAQPDTRRDAVLQVIFKALENLNQELEPAARVEINDKTPLFGADATLDSLSLVSVIVDVETELTLEWDAPVSLTDDRAMSREVSPFTDVGALADYVVELLLEFAPA
jgi:acyl carrier protein